MLVVQIENNPPKETKRVHSKSVKTQKHRGIAEQTTVERSSKPSESRSRVAAIGLKNHKNFDSNKLGCDFCIKIKNAIGGFFYYQVLILLYRL